MILGFLLDFLGESSLENGYTRSKNLNFDFQSTTDRRNLNQYMTHCSFIF